MQILDTISMGCLASSPPKMFSAPQTPAPPTPGNIASPPKNLHSRSSSSSLNLVDNVPSIEDSSIQFDIPQSFLFLPSQHRLASYISIDEVFYTDNDNIFDVPLAFGWLMCLPQVLEGSESDNESFPKHLIESIKCSLHLHFSNPFSVSYHEWYKSSYPGWSSNHPPTSVHVKNASTYNLNSNYYDYNHGDSSSAFSPNTGSSFPSTPSHVPGDSSSRSEPVMSSKILSPPSSLHVNVLRDIMKQYHFLRFVNLTPKSFSEWHDSKLHHTITPLPWMFRVVKNMLKNLEKLNKGF
jgi:hypothetical protein